MQYKLISSLLDLSCQLSAPTVGGETRVAEKLDQSEVPASEVEDTVRQVETSIAVIERTLADPQCRGQALETVLTRQLAVKIDKLANLSERRSVIVHTSTPNISTAAGAAPAPTFFGSEEERISSPEVPEAPPFQIFIDPPSEENPILQIPAQPTNLY